MKNSRKLLLVMSLIGYIFLVVLNGWADDSRCTRACERNQWPWEPWNFANGYVSAGELHHVYISNYELHDDICPGIYPEFPGNCGGAITCNCTEGQVTFDVCEIDVTCSCGAGNEGWLYSTGDCRENLFSETEPVLCEHCGQNYDDPGACHCVVIYACNSTGSPSTGNSCPGDPGCKIGALNVAHGIIQRVEAGTFVMPSVDVGALDRWGTFAPENQESSQPVVDALGESYNENEDLGNWITDTMNGLINGDSVKNLLGAGVTSVNPVSTIDAGVCLFDFSGMDVPLMYVGYLWVWFCHFVGAWYFFKALTLGNWLFMKGAGLGGGIG